MLRAQTLGAAAASVPTTTSPAPAVNRSRRALALGAFGALALGLHPLASRAAEAADASAGAKYTTPCSSAKAVHDQQCPNYTGFKTPAEKEAVSRQLAERAQRQRAARKQGRQAKVRIGRTLDRGVASWYGPGFQGRLTANGERFDMNELTAAHKTLPFGTHVQVKSNRTGKAVVVRINDRGPFVGGRIIDLSRAAAQQLGIVAHGHDVVVLREATVSAA